MTSTQHYITALGVCHAKTRQSFCAQRMKRMTFKENQLSTQRVKRVSWVTHRQTVQANSCLAAMIMIDFKFICCRCLRVLDSTGHVETHCSSLGTLFKKFKGNLNKGQKLLPNIQLDTTFMHVSQCDVCRKETTLYTKSVSWKDKKTKANKNQSILYQASKQSKHTHFDVELIPFLEQTRKKIKADEEIRSKYGEGIMHLFKPSEKVARIRRQQWKICSKRRYEF